MTDKNFSAASLLGRNDLAWDDSQIDRII